MINSGPLNGPNAMAVNERLLELLAEAGLKPADAARTAYLLFVYVVGSVALLITDAEGLQAWCRRRRSGSLPGARSSPPHRLTPSSSCRRGTYQGALRAVRAVPVGSAPTPRRRHRHHHPGRCQYPERVALGSRSL